MSTHDLVISNDTNPNLRADLNLALAAIGSQQAGTADPPATYAYELQARTDLGLIKRRNAANSGWVIHDTLAEVGVVGRSSNTILGTADHKTTIHATSGFTQTLTAAATLGDRWEIDYIIDSGATIVFDPNSTEQIDGATTKTVAGPASLTIKCTGSAFFTMGQISAAAQSDQETATSTSTFVAPGTQKFHPSAVKAWVNFNGTGTPAINASYNVSSITDNGTGDFTVNFTTAFSSANYGVSGITGGLAGYTLRLNSTSPLAAGSCRLDCRDGAAALVDGITICASFFGDQ